MNTENKYIALCPACSARLPMNDSHMEIADGNIRCGKCNTAFYAPDHLLQGHYSPVASKPEQDDFDSIDAMPFDLVAQEEHIKEILDPIDTTTHTEESEEAITDQPYLEEPITDQAYLEEPDLQNDQADSLHIAHDHDQIISSDSNRTTRKRRSKRKLYESEDKTSSKKWLWIPAILILLVFLSLQILVVNVSSWSHNPLMRGIYSQICATFLCELPVDLKPVSLNIEIAGYRRLENGSYEVKGLLTNWAYYSQKLPIIRIFFVNLTETEQFTKNLNPQEYLAESQQDKTNIDSEERFEFSVTIDDLATEAKHLFPRMELISY